MGLNNGMNPSTAEAIAALLDVVERDVFVLWLFRPHPQLDGDAPAQRIIDGDAESVAAIIDQFLSGAFF